MRSSARIGSRDNNNNRRERRNFVFIPKVKHAFSDMPHGNCRNIIEQEKRSPRSSRTGCNRGNSGMRAASHDVPQTSSPRATSALAMARPMPELTPVRKTLFMNGFRDRPKTAKRSGISAIERFSDFVPECTRFQPANRQQVAERFEQT